MGRLPDNILADLKRDRLVREGHWAYSTGRHSAGLLDRDHLTTDPVAVGHMSYAIAKRFFVDHVDSVASPSIQGAGLALWIAHFLDPKARVVPADRTSAGPAVPPGLDDLVRGKRVLLVDDLIAMGDLMRPLAHSVEASGGEVIGIATLWNIGDPGIGRHPVFGLLNTAYEAFPADLCPLCAAGAPAATTTGY
jgi:orotate phosphoribosyltransferase